MAKFHVDAANQIKRDNGEDFEFTGNPRAYSNAPPKLNTPEAIAEMYGHSNPNFPEERLNMDNYPDDINNYNNDPRSPLYDDGGRENAEQDLREVILSGDCIEDYMGMFDSMDSDVVLGLLRDFHHSQCVASSKQLIAQLDTMLDALIQSKIEEM